MNSFESAGIGDQAGQDLQQDKEKSFIISLCFANMLAKSSASFSAALDSFLKSSEMWTPEKWEELLNGSMKWLTGIAEIDPLGAGKLIAEGFQAMGSGDAGGDGDGDYNGFSDNSGGDDNNIANDYADELGQAVSFPTVAPEMEDSFTGFMSEYTGVDIGNMINASSHTESAGESYDPSPPDFTNIQSTRGMGIAAAG